MERIDVKNTGAGTHGAEEKTRGDERGNREKFKRSLNKPVVLRSHALGSVTNSVHCT